MRFFFYCLAVCYVAATVADLILTRYQSAADHFLIAFFIFAYTFTRYDDPKRGDKRVRDRVDWDGC